MCSTQLHASSNSSVPLRKLTLAKLVKKSQDSMDSKRLITYTIQVHSLNLCFKINFNIIRPSTYAPPKWYHVFGLLIEIWYAFRIIQMLICVPAI